MSPKHKYVPLSPPPGNAAWWSCLYPAICFILPIITGIGGFLAGNSMKMHSLWLFKQEYVAWSYDRTMMKKHPIQFSGSFDFTNRYRGPPSVEIDEEWKRFTYHPLIDGTASLLSVTADEIAKSNMTTTGKLFESTVKYGEESGGGYMATLEMFHQLHCLNMLRKAVHDDYYKEMRPSGDGSHSDKMTTHLDHCIEILRQVIGCYGDTGLITFHWVRGNPVPYPDFNTWHQCRDPEEILAWAKAREAPISERVKKEDFSGVVELEEAP